MSSEHVLFDFLRIATVARRRGLRRACGRLKELIITAGGENIAPLPIENNIVAELSDILSYVIGEISNE